MAELDWGPDFDGHIVRLGWNKWADEYRRPIVAEAVLQAPKQKGTLKSSITSRMIGGGKHGTQIMRVMATAPHADYVFRGRGPVKPKKGGVLYWLVGMTGGHLDSFADGTAVVSPGVGPAKANPFLVRAVQAFGLEVVGYRENPKSKRGGKGHIYRARRTR